MKWGAYQENQENLVSVSMKNNENKDYYITRDNNCKPGFKNNENFQFLVNPDNIENLEWKPLERKLFRTSIPPFPVETCDGYIIARNIEWLGYITAKKKNEIVIKSNTEKTVTEVLRLLITESLEVLAINFVNITEEYFTNVQFNPNSVQRNKMPSMFKNLTVVNHNCDKMKQHVTIDNGFEETASFQTGNTLLIGGSFGFKEVGLEAGLKVDYSETETENNSKVKKTGDQYTQELDIPPRSSCKLVIGSSVFKNTVPFTADLTRVYKNDDVRTVSINGTYSYKESSEIKTNFESCNTLSDSQCIDKNH